MRYDDNKYRFNKRNIYWTTDYSGMLINGINFGLCVRILLSRFNWLLSKVGVSQCQDIFVVQKLRHEFILK